VRWRWWALWAVVLLVAAAGTALWVVAAYRGGD
jgi:hypothetical protein